eukprot:CAMPEP_0168179040 /NCGR_PEP_ID=MMETSP0139_2-20121125/9569_1 /TAXON_ID=44445 /ORGANISM="Pseudo-nitzschia australis, Strain 10249 10 AB" /LENGTH=379 /DNA_ID=CAMNT_0008098719 /DNA_START=161 /DNA_END=1300 /DNA_ORIENTATION=-
MTQSCSFILAVGLVIIISRVVNGASGTDLFNKWMLNLPLVSFFGDNNTLAFDYGISELMSSDNIRAEIFTGDCENQLFSTDGILSQVFDSRGAHVFQIDPKTLAKNPAVFSTIDYPDGDGADMKFCLRYMLWSGPETDAASIMINYFETILIISFNLKAGVLTAFSVDAKKRVFGDENNVIEMEQYEARGYLCDPYTYERVEPPPGAFSQGMVISICAELDEGAIKEGLYLEGVSDFYWTRERMIGYESVVTTQHAIKDGVPANALSAQQRISSTLCLFQTILFADFFVTPGIVSGIGQVKFGFGTGDDARRTSERPYSRFLQQQQEDGSDPNLEISIPVGNRRPPLKGSKTAGGDTISYGRSLLLFIVCSATTVLLWL